MQIDDTQTWSVDQLNKAIGNFSAKYVKACTCTCKRKVQKIMHYECSKSQKGHNSYKNWSVVQ